MSCLHPTLRSQHELHASFSGARCGQRAKITSKDNQMQADAQVTRNQPDDMQVASQTDRLRLLQPAKVNRLLLAHPQHEAQRDCGPLKGLPLARGEGLPESLPLARRSFSFPGGRAFPLPGGSHTAAHWRAPGLLPSGECPPGSTHTAAR